MTRVIKAAQPVPYDIDTVSVFLGGTIDMGGAENWQELLTLLLDNYSDRLLIVNPRRDDWDSSWEQKPMPGTPFYEQVSWELYHQERADINIYYFAPDSKSPITLMELGLFANSSVMVFCNERFYRYGNVKIVCDRYNIPIYESMSEFLQELRRNIETKLREKEISNG